MSFLGILPPLLFGLMFIVPAWWLYRRGYRGWATAPAATALILFAFTLAVYLQDARRTQARYDLERLVTELARPDLLAPGDLRDDEETLFLASIGSQALYRGTVYYPAARAAADSVLTALADWVSTARNWPQWRRGTDWDQEVFFLAHAGAVLGHYQLTTGRENHAEAFQRIGRYLGQRLRRSRYKHLYSRNGEDLLRPADNAAALYTLSLYDRYYAETFSAAATAEWSAYLSRELYHAESRLPCAAFTITNRCAIPPNAVASGLYIAYRAAADPATDDIPYREWLHYFKRGGGNPFGLTVRPNMRKGEPARLCGEGIAPLECERFEAATGLWAAAEYGGGYTYFRLFTPAVLRRWLGRPDNYAAMRPARRVRALTSLALRTVAEGTGARR